MGFWISRLTSWPTNKPISRRILAFSFSSQLARDQGGSLLVVILSSLSQVTVKATADANLLTHQGLCRSRTSRGAKFHRQIIESCLRGQTHRLPRHHLSVHVGEVLSCSRPSWPQLGSIALKTWLAIIE